MPIVPNSFEEDTREGWLRLLSVFHKQNTLSTRGWAGSPFSWEFDEIICAIFERFVAAELPSPEFVVRGNTIAELEGFRSAGVRAALNSIDEKVNLVRQIHLFILQLAGKYHTYESEVIDEDMLFSWGIKETGHTFPADFNVAVDVLKRLVYRVVLLFREDEVFNFIPEIGEDFVYADWALPRFTPSGHPIEGFSIRDAEACYGEYRLTSTYDSRYQNRIQLRYTFKYNRECWWVFANIRGGVKLIPAEVGTVEVDNRLEVRHLGTPRPEQETVWSTTYDTSTAFRGIKKGAEKRTKLRIRFNLEEHRPDSYYYLTSTDWVPTSGSALYAYRSDCLYITLNGVLLPQRPLTPVEVSGVLKSSGNVLELAFEGNYYRSDFYLLETIHVDTEVPSPAILRYSGECYEPVGAPQSSDSGYYAYYGYYYEGNNRACWTHQMFTEHAKFSVYGLVNADFACYGVPSIHEQAALTITARPRTTLQEQRARVSFVVGEGTPYRVFFSYRSTAGVFRTYHYVDGIGLAEITELGFTVPADVAWNLNVTVVPLGKPAIRAMISCYGILRGAVFEPLPACAEVPIGEEFSTQFGSWHGVLNNPPQPSLGATERS